jgi:uncharacterized protein (TIGR02646 family)
VYKRPDQPDELKEAYNHDGVCKQLLADQKDKCYLCEMKVVTNYEVEHFIPQKVAPHLEKEWSNLLVACRYCNGKKSAAVNLLNPLTNNIEDIIRHDNDFGSKRALFTSNDPSVQTLETIKLLSSIFNGNNGLRRVREERFYEEYLQKITFFLTVVNKYLAESKQEYKEVIVEQLDMKSELLGFKYTIITTHPILNREFGTLITWNK